MKVGEIYYPPYKEIPKRLTCVYKLSFEGGYNYTGSTTDLKLRIQAHFNCIKTQSNYLGLISDLPLVLLMVEVLYVDNKMSNCLAIERSVINTQIENPLNLNKYHKKLWALPEEEIAIIKYLADGFTVGQIATHMGKNDRWMQNVIMKTKKKFGAFTLPHLVAICLFDKIIE